jgi:hypothetical protein
VRLGERHQVADRPGDDVAVAVAITVTALVGAENIGNVARDRRFFGDDGRSLGWRGRYCQSSIVSPARPWMAKPSCGRKRVASAPGPEGWLMAFRRCPFAISARAETHALDRKALPIPPPECPFRPQ